MYVRISGRIRLNAHSLNAQGGGGTNYIEITKTKVTVKTGNGWAVVEVPAITGNMLKHWHFTGFVDYFKTTPYGMNLTERALRYNGTRFGQGETTATKANSATVQLNDEATIIGELADADVHGFLAPKTGVRRVALVKVPFILPAEDFIREVEGERLITAIKHNRVDVNESGAISSGNDTAQMLFSREYATGLYGFSIVLDLGLVGVPQSSPVKFEKNQLKPNIVIDPNERKARIESALKALVPMLSGYLGANLARSFPVFKVEELIAIASEEPIPALVHGFYNDYIEANKAIIKNARALGFNVKAFTYKVNLGEDVEATEVSSVEELVAELLNVEGGME
ncbi:type I-A CRISPR-associated protein Cas7/Csa2 [Thermococcus siculi]|nr:type I-A CRISPR-associated protein Cas7/Csa2 [Thermococcus siculi]